MISASQARELNHENNRYWKRKRVDADLMVVEENIKKATNNGLTEIFIHLLFDDTVKELTDIYGYKVEFAEWVVPKVKTPQKCYKISW